MSSLQEWQRTRAALTRAEDLLGCWLALGLALLLAGACCLVSMLKPCAMKQEARDDRTRQ